MDESTRNRTRSAPAHLTLTVGQDRGDLQAGANYLSRPAPTGASRRSPG